MWRTGTARAARSRSGHELVTGSRTRLSESLRAGASSPSSCSPPHAHTLASTPSRRTFVSTSRHQGLFQSLKSRADSTLLPAKPGTAPESPIFLVLHTSTPAVEWASHPPKESALLRELQLKLRSVGGTVNIAHRAEGGGGGGEAMEFPGRRGREERYDATLYRGDGRIPVEISGISLGSMGVLDQYLAGGSQVGDSSKTSSSAERHLYVCTHNSRDCRCGTHGVQVFNALRTYFLPTSTFTSSQPSSSNTSSLPSPSPSVSVSIREIAHVGGHKYAANILDFPSGDMYAAILPSNVEGFAEALAASAAPLGEEGAASRRNVEQKKLLLSHWRGRFGMKEEEQVSYAAELKAKLENTKIEPEPELKPVARRERKRKLPLVFETHEGERIEIQGEEGRSVMEIARANALPAVEGTCGGKLECATCHVYISAVDSSSLPPSMPPVSEGEEDMLEYALFRTDASRLSCQLTVTQDLSDWCTKSGGIIKLPRY